MLSQPYIRTVNFRLEFQLALGCVYAHRLLKGWGLVGFQLALGCVYAHGYVKGWELVGVQLAFSTVYTHGKFPVGGTKCASVFICAHIIEMHANPLQVMCIYQDMKASWHHLLSYCVLISKHQSFLAPHFSNRVLISKHQIFLAPPLFQPCAYIQTPKLFGTPTFPTACLYTNIKASWHHSLPNRVLIYKHQSFLAPPPSQPRAYIQTPKLLGTPSFPTACLYRNTKAFWHPHFSNRVLISYHQSFLAPLHPSPQRNNSSTLLTLIYKPKSSYESSTSHSRLPSFLLILYNHKEPYSVVYLPSTTQSTRRSVSSQTQNQVECTPFHM